MKVFHYFKKRFSNLQYFEHEQNLFDDLCIVCLLHDVIEDYGIDSNQAKYIKENYSEFIYDTVLCLSRNKNEQYFSYIERVTKNEYASIVKLCDLLVNIDRSEIGSSRMKRYHKAADIIVKIYPNIYEHK